jgi:hypothetical protein
VDPLALNELLAHGGIPGAIAEAALAFAVIGIFGSIWLRERSARKSRDQGDFRERDD